MYSSFFQLRYSILVITPELEYLIVYEVVERVQSNNTCQQFLVCYRSAFEISKFPLMDLEVVASATATYSP